MNTLSSASGQQIFRVNDAIKRLLDVQKAAPDDPWWAKRWSSLRTPEEIIAKALEQARWSVGTLRICLEIARIFEAPDIARNVLHLLTKRNRYAVLLYPCSPRSMLDCQDTDCTVAVFDFG